MRFLGNAQSTRAVAPVRERGLKSLSIGDKALTELGRSRKGAWIEMFAPALSSIVAHGRSRKGAWIEIPQANLSAFAVGSRSRKGAWIEIERDTKRL